jgi:hypothetical protein
MPRQHDATQDAPLAGVLCESGEENRGASWMLNSAQNTVQVQHGMRKDKRNTCRCGECAASRCQSCPKLPELPELHYAALRANNKQVVFSKGELQLLENQNPFKLQRL